jgi:anti-anti-sigma factor
MRLADLHFSSRDGHVIALVVGEIDMSNAGELARALTDETPNDADGLVLELSGIDYLDSAGIHLVYRLRESLRARGQSLAIVVPRSSPVYDALRLAGIERHLKLWTTVDAAVGSEDLGRDAPSSGETVSNGS